MQRLHEQDLAEVPAVHLDRRSRIQRPPQTLLRGLTPARRDPTPHLSSWPSPRRLPLHHLRPTTERTANKDGPEQASPMLVYSPCEPRHPLLIRHGRLPQVHRAPIRQRQREANGREPCIPIQQRTTLVMPQNGTALRHEEM